MRAPRVWLPLLIGTIVAEMAWSLVDLLLFLARRRARKEEIKVVLIGTGAGKETGRRLACVAVMGFMLVAAGCSSSGSSAVPDDRPPIMRAQDLNFRKAEETLVEVLSPVYGASSPPWDTLNETVMEVDPESGRSILEMIAELLVP